MNSESNAIIRIDIFCSVVDNFGDIGICWRLAQQLVAEQGRHVRLWVDDVISFQRICPQLVLDVLQQQLAGVEIHHWLPESFAALQRLQGVDPVDFRAELLPDLVVEALACTVPPHYLQHIAALKPATIWVNLEYLSAESWVEGCHGLSSPQAGIGLAKYFFFPGFTSGTGGLLREQHKVAELDHLQQNTATQLQFWHSLGLAAQAAGRLKITLFCYGQQALADFMTTLAAYHQPVLLLVPPGLTAAQLQQLWPELQQQPVAERVGLTIALLPFLSQARFDLLLAASDVNFVRGEDSIIRAQWAGRPFIWQIYRQQAQAHRVKLDAFLQRYLQQAPAAIADLLLQVHQRWDLELPLAELLPYMLDNIQEIGCYNRQWRQNLMLQQDLATNLVRFAENKCKMPRNFS